jgi:hypothetical protein
VANPRRTNGHRRDQLRRRHLAGAANKVCQWEHCPWPHEPFDTTLHYLDPKAPEVDEIVPTSLGGDPLSWSNTRLLHRDCNRRRGNGTGTLKTLPGPAQQPRTSRAW